ncbi:MAG: 3D domain-containing protein [Thermoactinomyces sp.]
MNKILLSSLAMILILLAGCSGSSQKVEVLFSDQPKMIKLDRSDDSLAEALEDAGLNVAELKQKYQPSIQWNQPLEEQSRVYLTCNCKVSLEVGGKKTGTFQTLAKTVGEVLKEKNIPVSEWDEINVPLDQRITDGTKIIVDRYESRIQKKVEQIPYNTKKVEDDEIAKGEKKVEQEGKKGKKIYELTMMYKNGQPLLKDGKPLVEKRLVDTVKPVEEIVKIGTNEELAKEDMQLSAAGTMTVQATGYTHTGGRTATGTYPRRGTIAVDPDVIPLGTKLYVPGYGYGVAEDTGGAVQGRIIDLFFETREEAIKWGRRTVTIKILK